MNSRERVARALAHQEPDRVPLDLGASGTTGMHVSMVYALRQALGLDRPGTPVRVVEPYQMLGEIGPDLQEALGVDVVGVWGLKTLFGFRNEGWKPWTTFDGTPVLVPEQFNTEADEEGRIPMYPEGDRTVPPSAVMPKGGFYFDAVMRQPPIDDALLRVEDNLEEFGPVSREDLDHFRAETERLHRETDKAVMIVFGGAGFGDIALVPGPMLKRPRGIRDVAEWYMSTVTRRDHILRIFERQCEIALDNLAEVHGAVGERASVIWVSGTDFGAQTNSLVSPEAFRILFKPFYTRLNTWIHEHTPWKTFIHTCGSVRSLLPDIVEAGFDILSPVQTSAAGMDPAELKSRFGDRLTFWGGGIETQSVLPFGTPQEVRDQVRERVRIFGRGGGFVFNPIHNVQAKVPIANLLAMYEALREESST